jgi:hypothetical protein
MKSGIFRIWMRYWMILYGTITFALLTLGSFLSEIVMQHPTGRALFTCIWALTLIHVGLGVFMGNFLVRKTRRAIEHIVHLDGEVVATQLRTHFGNHEKPLPQVYIL